jgi:hypothetical protein
MFCLVGIVSGLSVSQHNDVAVGVSVFIDENFARVFNIFDASVEFSGGAEVINTDEKCF